MHKTGQTSLFVILGILLLLLVALYGLSFFVGKPTEQAKQTIGETNQPLKAFVDSCVEQTAKLALFFFGFIGGDLTPPHYEQYFSYDERYKIPYLYNKGKTVFLTPEVVQNALGKYVDSRLHKCTGTFAPFPGLSITQSPPQTKVLLLENEVTFSVHYPITVTRDGKKSTVGPLFSSRVPLRLKEMTTITNKIIEQKKQDPSLIHWDYLTEITKKNYNITAYAEVDETLIYRVVDEKYTLLGEPYIFQFAVRVS